MDDSQVIIFQEEIISFWLLYGRHDLPWRQTTDPWKLILAEVLLRKTTAQQVVPVYKFLADFCPAEIAQMNRDDLQQILKPLGISGVRADQLKEIANHLITSSNVDYKSDIFLRSMPGIGRYISNSVQCCAFGFPVPALDANMIRIIQRLFGWKSSRKRPREDKALWEFAEKLVPIDKSKEFNWGILDFAAKVCTNRNPKCMECAISGICTYFQTQNFTIPT